MKLRDTLKNARVLILAACGLITSGAFAQPLAGVGNVPGTAPDGFAWPDLVTAINDLDTSGVLIGGGGVTINLLAGNPQIAPAGGYLVGRTGLFAGIAGTSALDPINIIGNSNTITANAGNTIGAINDAIFKFLGADFVTLTGFAMTEDNVNNTLVATAAGNDMTEFGVALFHGNVNDGSNNNTIIGNTIALNRLYFNSFGVYSNARTSSTSMTVVEDVTSTGGSNSGNRVHGNTISNVNMGVCFIGSGFLTTYMDQNNEVGGAAAIQGNIISNWGGAAALSSYVSNTGTSYCVFMNHQWGARCSNNNITSAAVNTTTTFRGIVHDYTALSPTTNALTTNITSNQITMSNAAVSGTFRAIDVAATVAVSVPTMTININGNTILNCAVSGPAASILLGGIFNAEAAGTVSMSNNVLRGNTSTATTGGFTGVQNTAIVPTLLNMNGNQIGNGAGGAITYTAATSGAFTGVSNTAASATGTVSLSSNNFQGIVYNLLSSAAVTCISNNVAWLNTTMNNNTWTNLVCFTTGSFTFMGNSATRPAGAVCNANSNSIVGSFNKSGAGGSIVIYNSFGISPNTCVENNLNNNFSNLSCNGACTINPGWRSSDGSTTSPTRTVSGNTFSNWTCGTGTITVLSSTFGNGSNPTVPVCNIFNNTISNIVSNNSAITGIESTSGYQTFRDNTVTGLNTNGSGLVRGFGISGATNTILLRNKICDLRSNAGSVNGIQITSLTLLTMRNNLIGDLRVPNGVGDNLVMGVNCTSTIGTLNMYFNTIYLAATSTGSSFGSSALSMNTGASLDLRSNILVNNSGQAGIGVATAYRRSSTTNSTYLNSSDRNIFYAGTPGLFRPIHWDGTNAYQTLATYKAYIGPTRDANSQTELPAFASTTCGTSNFLHFNPATSTLAESGGANVPTDSTDYDLQVRQGFVTYAGTSTIAPDIGADEFNGTNPALCSGTPSPGTITGALSPRCSGQPSQTMTLTGATTGVAGITYQWQSSLTPGGPYSNLGNGLTQATGVLTDTTYYIAIVTCGLSGLSDSTAEFAIVVNPVPVATATNEGQICEGDTIELHGTSNVPGSTFAWTGPASYTATGADPIRLNGLLAHAGVYSVIATANSCSSVAATTTQVVNPAVVVTSVTATPNPVCENGTAALSFTATGLGTTGTYCTPTYTSGTGSGDYISSVSITGTPLLNPTAGAPSPYSTVYPASGATTCTLNANSSYTVNAAVGSWSSSNGITIWIDFNQDQDFVDLGEQIGFTNGMVAFQSTSYVFTVPVNAVNGLTRMRVREIYASSVAALPCGSQSFGENEDYQITIAGGSNVGTFLWTPSTYLDNPAISTPTASGIAGPISYTVTATNSGGCSGSNSVSITVNPAVDAGLDGSNTVCSLNPAFDMFSFLGGTPDAGGSWLTPGNAAHSNMFDPSTDASGCYKYVVPASAPCTNDTALVCVTNNIAPTWYADVDLDGFGDAAADSVACSQPAGYVANNTDLCPADPLKQSPGVCGCGVPDTDTDADGVADCIDNCPLLYGQIGSYCDDGNAGTLNDQINGSCVCVGVANPCGVGGQAGVLQLQTDNFGSQTTWQIDVSGGGPTQCSGVGPYPNNSTLSFTCCLPTGCYDLKVFDSFGDGMIAGVNGGYILRNENNKRIIDNGNDGAFASLSQAAQSFCVPIGNNEMLAGSCDQMNLLFSSLMSVTPNALVSAQFGIGNQTDDGYQYWIFNPDGGYSRRIFLNLLQGAGPAGPTRCATLSLSSIVTNPVPAYVLLNIRVRHMVGGVYGEFGPACRMKINPNLPCVATQLTTTATPVVSCGATGVFINGGVLWANNVASANKYQFQFTRPGYSRNASSNTRSLTLAVWQDQPLLCGLTYNVKVRASYDGGITWCPYGATCTITTEACPPFAGGNQHSVTQNGSDGLVLWPNPNRDGQLYLALDGIEENVATATVEITDLFGKLVRRDIVALEGSTTLNTVVDLDPSMANGVYTVTVIAGQSSFNKRLVLE